MRIEKRSVFGWGTSAAGRAHPGNGLVVHYDGADQGLADKDHSACRTYWKNIRNFHIGPNRGWLDIGYCVDEMTEILTESGWKTYREVAPNDVVLTLNHSTGMAEWQQLLDIYIFPATSREMIRMEGHSHSSLTTPGHRWPVERFYRRTWTRRQKNEDGTWKATGRAPRTQQGHERTWATSETLTYWDRIPIAAQCADLPTEAKWSDAFVELLAWFWTEGHIKPQSRSRLPSTGVAIYQKKIENITRIRAALYGVFGPPVDRFPRTDRSPTDGVPRWREYEAPRGITVFHLSVDAGKKLVEQAPGRVPRHEFLRSLTRAQLALYLETSLLADGDNGRTVTWQNLAQKSREAAEAFQYAAILAGRSTSLRQNKAGMWVVHLRSRTGLNPRAAASRKQTFSIDREIYNGSVWCPRTANGTWLARRTGSVYFTGNSYATCPHGIVMEGRGLNRRQAAQPGGNSTWYSCTFMSGPTEQPTGAQLTAFRELRSWLRGKGVAAAIKPHSAFVATNCCGDILHRLIHNGTLTSGKPPMSEPATIKPSARITTWPYRGSTVMLRGRQDPHVEAVQKRLNELGATPKLAIDGVFGPGTETAVRAFQKRARLGIDGIVGSKTWARLFTSK